jgi:hypothetical protein
MDTSTAAQSALDGGGTGQVLRDMVEFFEMSGCHQSPAYLVDALIEVNPIVLNWQAYIDLLLGDDCLLFFKLNLLELNFVKFVLNFL